MKHGEKMTLNAVSGQFTTLNGQPYIGPYHLMDQGIPMTGTHHDASSVVLIPVQEGKSAQPSITSIQPNTTLNENETEYDLMPTVINRPPIILKSITEASTPQIRPYSAADASGNFMYQFSDGTVKVHKNTTIVLRVEAVQPDTFNVDNGILVIKPKTAELVYQWYFNGELIGGLGTLVGQGSTREIIGNELILTNIQPPYAGNYTCTVSNDIGTTDGGSIELEVFNSNVDSLFYNNLIQNGDATDGTTNWNSINDGLVARTLNNSIDGSFLKSIIVDPMNPRFSWTTEMLNPAPYNLRYGAMRPPNRGDAITMGNENTFRLNNYFTRVDYTYTVNDGIATVKAYQDIDLSDLLEPHIKGAIYGISGLRGVFCAYIGNAIFNYEPTNEYVLPSERTKPASYYLGAPRLSVENFSKAGPGFVVEKVYVTVEEFENNQPIKSRILTQNGTQNTISTGTLVITDPWNKRLPQYRNKVYYPGDRKFASPDVPSLGDSRDAHLFVADDLVPDYEDRFTYGQYSEFTKAIIERLNPRTNKIRVSINIEAPELGLMLRERGSDSLPIDTGKLWAYLPWTSTWPSRSFGQRNNDVFPDPKNAYSRVLAEYRPDTQDLQQKLPKIGESRAFVSGLTFALVPIYSGSLISVTDFDVQDILSQNDSQLTLVESPIDKSLPAYNAAATGLRDLSVLFDMDTNKAEIRVLVEEKDIDTGAVYQLEYQPGLFPFTEGSTQLGPKTTTYVGDTKQDNKYQMYAGTPSTTTNGILIPLYVKSNANNIAFDAYQDAEGRYAIDGAVTYQRNGLETSITTNTTTGSLIIPVTENDDTSIVQLALTPRPVETPSTPLWSLGGLKAEEGYVAPIMPYQWYAIEERDRVDLLVSGSTQVSYNKFAVPNQPLNLNEWLTRWNADLFDGGAGLNKDGIQVEETQWHNSSRFVITVGVYDPNILTNTTSSLLSYQNYYLDFVSEGYIIHQTPDLGGVSRLFSFTKEEEYPNTEITFLNNSTGTYETYASPKYKNYLDTSTATTINPVFISQYTLQGTTTTIKLPNEILTTPQSEGGLGLPFNQNGEPDLVNYKVALFGVRPVTNGYALDTNTYAIDTTKTTTTPHNGQNTDFDFKYILKQIKVANTFG